MIKQNCLHFFFLLIILIVPCCDLWTFYEVNVMYVRTFPCMVIRQHRFWQRQSSRKRIVRKCCYRTNCAVRVHWNDALETCFLYLHSYDMYGTYYTTVRPSTCTSPQECNARTRKYEYIPVLYGQIKIIMGRIRDLGDMLSFEIFATARF